MALSDREQRLLKELEEQLQTEDPGFASSLQEPDSPGGFNVRNVVLGLLGALVGIGVLLFGIYQQIILLGIAGFLVMGAGAYFATTGGAGRSSNGGDFGNGGGGSGGSGGSGPRSSQPSPSGSFMSNLEDKWEQRRQQP